MDVIRLFQALMNAIGLSFNATAYAGKSTYTISKEEVDAWWLEHSTSPEYSKYYKGLTDEQKMLLYASGSNDFDTTMDNLNEYLKEHPEVKYRTADEFMTAYSNALISVQQNSVDYTKDNVTKTAYNITADILDATKQIANAVKKGNEVAKLSIKIQNYVKNVLGYNWGFNGEVFSERMSAFLEKHNAESYRYICAVEINNTSMSPSAKGIVIFLSTDTAISSFDFKSGTTIAPIRNGKVYPAFLDASILFAQYPDFPNRKLYCSLFTNSNDFTLFDNVITYDYDTDINSPDVSVLQTQAYDVNNSEKFNYYAYYGYSLSNSLVIDRKTGITKDYYVSKDVIGTDQTLVGITNDRADEDDDRVFIMNADGVETLARADADAYPEVLPSTIAAQIVDIGASVTDAVSDIATKNPEYPYVPPTPIVNSTGNNLFTLYDVTPVEMSELADYLWSKLPIDSFKKLFSSPSDSLISLVGYPVDIKSSGAKNIKIGYSDSGVSSHVITEYIQEFDLGSVYIPKYYNNFLDNNPYTKVSIYLPFIGSCSLDSDIVVGTTIKIKYRIELLTANCVALLSVSNINGTYPIYQFNGNVGMQFPLSSGSYASIYKNLITTGISAVAAYASGGALTPLAIASAANTVVGSKSEVSKSGNMNGSSGYCGILKPYVIVERPVTDIPGSYARYNGVVTNMALNIGSLQGYCVMENVDVSTVPCTENERAELTNLLLSGFFI